MVKVRHNHPLPARVSPHLADVGVHVPVAAAHHALGLGLAALWTLWLLVEVVTRPGVCQLDPGPTRGLLEVAHVAVGHAVITAHKLSRPRAFHPGAGLDLVLAVLEWHLYNSVISRQYGLIIDSHITDNGWNSPGQGEAAGQFLQLTLAGVQLTVAATHRLGAPVLLVAVGGALGPVQLVQAERGRHLVHVLPAVLPHHLTSVVVEFSIRSARQFAGTFKIISRRRAASYFDYLILKHLSLQCLVV